MASSRLTPNNSAVRRACLEKYSVPQDFQHQPSDDFVDGRFFLVRSVGTLPMYGKVGLADFHVIEHKDGPMILFREEHLPLAPFACGISVGLQYQHRGLFGPFFDVVAEVVGVVDVVAVEEGVELEFILQEGLELFDESFAVFLGMG